MVGEGTGSLWYGHVTGMSVRVNGVVVTVMM